MIPVHEWIWQDFKEMYTKRHKDKAMTDKDFIEIVHDWACRAMQHYIYDNMEDPWKLAKTSEMVLEAYEIALDCPGIHIRRDRDVWIVNTLHMFDTEARNAAELLRMVKGAKKYIETSEAVKQGPRMHPSAQKVIDEAMEIAKSVPAMTVKKITIPGYSSAPAWSIGFKDNDYTAEARGAAHLVEEVKAAKAYWEASQKPKKEPRTACDIIRDAYEIAENTPGMFVAELRDGGWAICLDDGDYSVEAQNAEALLKEVKVAKAYREASQKSKKGHQATRDMIRDAMEIAKNNDGEVIRVDGLDQETKELLLYFIESLTIRDASDILSKDYPCSVWDELHFIREKLRKSLKQPGRRQ
jgi:hypothetical protein